MPSSCDSGMVAFGEARLRKDGITEGRNFLTGRQEGRRRRNLDRINKIYGMGGGNDGITKFSKLTELGKETD